MVGKFKEGHFLIRIQPKWPTPDWPTLSRVGWECGIRAIVRVKEIKVKHILCKPVGAA